MKGRGRAVAAWALLAAGLLVVVVVGHQSGSGLPLDPNSPGPDGTKALVEVLRELGAQVRISAALPSPASAGSATALLLSDNLDDQGRARLTGWVRQGGTLVVTDPASLITQVTPVGSSVFGLVDQTLERDCAEPALRDVGRVSVPSGVLFAVPADTQGCFRQGDAQGDSAWMVVQPLGAGTVVRLGGADALVNAHLGEADNGLLVASLLAPSAGTSVTVLQPPLPGGGRRGLTDLIAPRVKLALWQLVIAVAVGNLLQRARKRRQAADLLAADLRRTIGERLGLPASAPPEQLAATVAARTGMLPERVLAVITPAPPHDEAALVALGQAVDSIRREVTSAR